MARDRKIYRAPRDSDVPIKSMAPGATWINKPSRWSPAAQDSLIWAPAPFEDLEGPSKSVHHREEPEQEAQYARGGRVMNFKSSRKAGC